MRCKYSTYQLATLGVDSDSAKLSHSTLKDQPLNPSYVRTLLLHPPRASRLDRRTNRTRMPTKLYVGNIPWSQTDQDLEDLFRTHGTVVSAEVVLDRPTGRSRDFGFVVMGSEEECKQAIQALDREEAEGRPIVVDHAHRKKNEVPRNRTKKRAKATSECQSRTGSAATARTLSPCHSCGALPSISRELPSEFF